MKLNIYKNQTEISKTYEVEGYDIMYGTVEDIFDILETMQDDSEDSLIKAVSDNRDKLTDLLIDVFPDMTKEEMKKIKVKELIPFFTELFTYVTASFDKPDSKN